MSNTSNFREAISQARGQALVGPNVIANALPYLGGGLILTALGVYGGLGVLESNPQLFSGTFFVAMIAEFGLFFWASNVARNGDNDTALPLLAGYSLLTGYTLSALIYMALGVSGVGIQGIALAAIGCGVAFIFGRQVGSNLTDEDALPLMGTFRIGLMGLLIMMVLQFVLLLFGVYTPSWLEIGISGVGAFLFCGAAVLDFYILPRTYQDEQHLSAALSMYLTYVNLFVFILRLLIAFNGGGNRD